MSESSSASASSSRSLMVAQQHQSSPESGQAGSANRIDLTIPHSLLVLPPTAAFVGLVIGMSRGGSRARLRFLAENAHRQPKTIQGWYFYTKTRNYRVFFAAAKTGSRYALGLGGATAGYCLLDESIGWTREQLFGHTTATSSSSSGSQTGGEATAGSSAKGKERAWEERHTQDGPAVMSDVQVHRGVSGRREGWREGPVRWEDGAMAGLIMGGIVGTAYTLPRPLFVRSLIMGSVLGSATSLLQIAQAYIGSLREAQEREREPRLATALPPMSQIMAKPDDEGLPGTGGVVVDRALRMGEKVSPSASGLGIDGRLSNIENGVGSGSAPETGDTSQDGAARGWWSWIPGFGR